MTQFVSIFLLLLAVCRQETYEVTGFSVQVASDVQRVKTAFVKPTNHPARFQRKTCDVPNRSFPRAKINTRVGLWSAASDTGDVAEAEDLASIQTLFSKYCDEDGLMSKETLEQMPPFSEMMVSRLCNRSRTCGWQGQRNERVRWMDLLWFLERHSFPFDKKTNDDFVIQL